MSDSGRVNDRCGHTVGHARDCPEAELESLRVEVAGMREKVKLATRALADVINPMDYLRREADKDGARLNEAAYQIANDRSTVVGIAQKALAIIDGNHSEDRRSMVKEASDGRRA